MEEIIKNIYRIGVPLTGNPLKEVNCYFIKGIERDLLIDTGFRRDECYEILKAGLDEIGWDPDHLDVVLTHLHSDHSGLAADICGENSRIYINERDYELLVSVLNEENRKIMHDRFVTEGFEDAMVNRIQDTNPARKAALLKVDDRFTCIWDGVKFYVGDYVIRAISVPGHSPGNMMFWIESEQLMFTGDHILFDISPNITAYAEMKDALGDYLNSLEKAKKYPVKIALPGHRKSGDYHERIEALLVHHERRLKEAEDVVRQCPGMSAYEITGYMKWKIRAKNWEDFPETQRWYAVGECLSHLDHLRLTNRIMRKNVDGTWRYYIKEN